LFPSPAMLAQVGQGQVVVAVAHRATVSTPGQADQADAARSAFIGGNDGACSTSDH